MIVFYGSFTWQSNWDVPHLNKSCFFFKKLWRKQMILSSTELHPPTCSTHITQNEVYRRAVVVITTAQLHPTKLELSFCRFKSCSRRVEDLRWWGPLTVLPAGNKAKRLSSVIHTTKTIHLLHHQTQFSWPLKV